MARAADAERLDAVRAEVLAQVAAKLPASLRLLDSLGRMASRSACCSTTIGMQTEISTSKVVDA